MLWIGTKTREQKWKTFTREHSAAVYGKIVTKFSSFNISVITSLVLNILHILEFQDDFRWGFSET